MSSPHRRSQRLGFWLGELTLCVRCHQVRPHGVLVPSRFGDDPLLCSTCNMDPAVAAALAREVGRRLEEARQRAADILEPPDREHIWLFQPNWGFAHLFAADERDSYCGHARITEPARPWAQKGAWAGNTPCGFCRNNHAAAMGERVEEAS